jgi:hypothetical protein
MGPYRSIIDRSDLCRESAMKNFSVLYAVVLLILAMAAVATSADAKTSKSKQQYLQIKLQEATISSVRAKPASTPASTAKTGGAMRSR